MQDTFNNLQNTLPSQPQTNLSDSSATENGLLFSRLYDQYASVMLGVISKMVTDKAEAAVILEQSFITISQQISKLKTGKQPMFVYLLGIARRTASGALAIRKQRSVASLQLTETGKLITPAWQTSSSISMGEVPINTADVQQNKFLNDVLFYNCTPEEAAASAGIPVEQARQQLRLAVQQLRNKA